ncbi:hypothetical protein ACIOJD_07050 [Streptomyces sp. NPDC088116]
MLGPSPPPVRPKLSAESRFPPPGTNSVGGGWNVGSSSFAIWVCDCWYD